MRLVLMGKPGAGKGTQAESIVRKLFVPHISTGDMFRAAIQAETAMGKLAKEYIEKGQLVPDEVTIGIVKDRLSQPDCKEGFLLDGFPRNVAQAQALDEMLKEFGTSLDAVVDINVPDEKLVERLTGRRVCRSCGVSYHMLYNPPATPEVCDKCGGELYQRSDDTEETVRSRLAVYESKTAPLLQYYKERGLLHVINGDQPINVVLAEVGKALDGNWS